MPANLTPEYREAEQAFREAREIPEKVRALEHMLRVMPKHKGTDRLQGNLKRKLSKLKGQLQKGKATARKGYDYHVDREDGQIVLLGLPNVGKSELVARATHAAPEVEDYPYTTRKPVAGMMPFENIQIQLVDLPPVDEEFMEPWMPQMVRYADGALLMVDCTGRLLDGVDVVAARLEAAKVHLQGLETPGEIPAGHAVKKTLIAANKLDGPGARDNLEVFQELLGDRFCIVPVSITSGENLDHLKRALYELLDIIRVYTKQPGRPPDLGAPFICRQGNTVIDLAARIHKDIRQHFKFARIWSENKYEGQMVQRDLPLSDGDIIEIHA